MKFLKIKRTIWFMLHWRVGLVASLFLLILAITGILLNHSRAMGLHHIFLDHPIILSAYNMNVSKELRGEGINLEKLILDIHTGKLFGIPGTIISDLTALAIIFLTGTGIYNLWKRKRKR